ncbi:2-furoyl-CoA dehydrogenase large subunit [Bosea sp. 62]|uniref:xanthine dehydrogenase family protein molybdopterin-binding subunit n=1 Tax=unclassified Bosea (in: a-proteobacteria) TaxID=2653178 RepID=UPI0012512B04|nr:MULTISPECIES: molybdopterin cofactor-binding domain-containing protein [unclassified Bosea (in: a-proteobacteria)]CAD5251508.1 2-furoyl-CoA dehydrogenase large subunit [Bosea sp. 7B]CAD5280455.1 2-furoyl-CoA dehydrogenase large subunit [Bosea sp. 21B]CAD5281560.1 2-furoyl-CoA dehydrogenase large subunit [Bosea sp. 46]VVT59429.1 2-furoyl-CoA dehydrogenase large subunit [Bosea sp. EC-HK365B]VXB28713.1 2-furoyl-CoA dehydrogenase large subunit [Bosea sp. 62]
MKAETISWTGQSVERVEDAALLTGRGRFIDDLGTRPGTLHAAILRSPHAHADILSIEIAAAATLPGVVAIVTGRDLAKLTTPMVAGLKIAAENWPMAVERVRYVGEPVAIAVAENRYLAEDALDAIEVTYRPLKAVVDPVASMSESAPVLHEKAGANLVSDRRFRYGEPAAAFTAAARIVSVSIAYPRNTGSPMETFGVVAEYDPHEDVYDILANFQGPFSIHTVLARALKVPGNRLRLRMPPDSGGSFGVKQGVAPYAVLIGVAARIAGRPVKWIEDRLEHLGAAVAATNRVTTLKAAVSSEGRISALDWDQIEDCGAYPRAPEPATLYRMHGNMTGAYDIRHVAMRNRVVLTNKAPTGLVRGFGGPQVYFALERLMQRIAVELRLDPLDVIRRNLIPAGAFPYRTATGALYDSGNYQTAVEQAVAGRLAELEQRRDAARAAGRRYGIGFAAVVEPSVSNMGYITTVLTAEERRKAGPKNGAQATATVSIDPVGSVSVHVASTPQGQGHRTVLAQVVADIFGLPHRDIRVVADLDTGKDAWSIASGNYSSRFAAAVAGAAHLAATRLRDKLALIAADQLKAEPGQIGFAGGAVFAKGNPDKTIPFGRIAALCHWSPALLPDGVDQTIRETAFWTPPQLTAPSEGDEINSSLCHGFIFDMAGVEVDPSSGKVRIDRYVTMHDCGTVLHPGMVEGQIRGGFAQALGATFYEELAYAEDGAFLTGTFADYLLPTATETPDIEILHIETPSPFTPLGTKGVGEGNCMSTPACLANAVADALGVSDIALPLTPARLAALAAEPEPTRPATSRAAAPAARPGDRSLRGEGEARVRAAPEAIWAMLLDVDTLASIIPGCHGVQKLSETHFKADVTLGVGPVKGRYKAEIRLEDLDEPQAATLTGSLSGALGTGGGFGRVTLTPDGKGGTVIAYAYEAAVGGKVAAIGGRLLDGAAKAIIGQFFAALARKASPGRPGLLARLFGRRA